MEWVPFTYGQKLQASDERIDIPKSGPKMLLQRTYKGPAPSHHQLNCFGYRNGNGGVTLALSSEHSGKELGCVYLYYDSAYLQYSNIDCLVKGINHRQLWCHTLAISECS
jgi:hypothetical protein